MAGVREYTDESKLKILLERSQKRARNNEQYDPDTYRKNCRSNKDIKKSLDVLRALRIS